MIRRGVLAITISGSSAGLSALLYDKADDVEQDAERLEQAQGGETVADVLQAVHIHERRSARLFDDPLVLVDQTGDDAPERQRQGDLAGVPHEQGLCLRLGLDTVDSVPDEQCHRRQKERNCADSAAIVEDPFIEHVCKQQGQPDQHCRA